MAAKILITGLANTGKTTLLKSLNNVLVFARDGKPFPLELTHVNVPDYDKIEEVINLVEQKLDAYKEKFGAYPDTVVFDSVSRIFTDIEANCDRKFKGYEVWKNINTEINAFTNYLNDLQNGGVNVVLTCHIRWDENAKRYIETSKGSFGHTGGFLSTVDYAVNIDLVGAKRIITHKNSSVSRSLLDDIPDKQDINDFNLQEYLDKVKAKSDTAEKWSI